MSDTGAPYIGRSLLRREDRRLLTGQGQFIADLVLPRMLHAVFVRSPLAHARIRAVDLSRAAAAPGVALALDGAELLQLLPPVPEGQISLPSKWTTRRPAQIPQSAAAAAGARQGAACRRGGRGHRRREPLPGRGRGRTGDARTSRSCRRSSIPRRRCARTAPIVHDRFDTNLIGAFSVGKGDADAALARAPHRLQRRFYHHRYAAVPMECRGVVGAYDPRTDSATIWSSTQVVHWVRREAAAHPRPARSAGALHRARRRRRLRRQGPCLSRRPADHRSSRAGSAGRCAGSRIGAST